MKVKCKECGLELKASSLASHEKACVKKSQARKRERELEDIVMGQASKQGIYYIISTIEVEQSKHILQLTKLRRRSMLEMNQRVLSMLEQAQEVC